MSSQEALAGQTPRRSLGVAHWFARHFRRLACGELRLEMPVGSMEVFRGSCDGPTAHLLVRRPYALLRRIVTRGDIGLAEAFIEGYWDSKDLTALLDLLYLNLEHLNAGRRGLPLSRYLDRIIHRLRPNSRRGSRRNIASHYDLGNDFYRIWLDESMTYSAAHFARPEDVGSDDEPLFDAQQRKYARMLDSLGAAPGQHILEVGCGWGGFAEHAARRGYRVTGITLSREQLGYARERVAKAGLEELVELRLQDYRDVTERFDHVVSIEMIEAVGEAYWPTYFEALGRLTRPGGRIAVQGITIDETMFESYRRRPDFIQLFIFPGGMLMPPRRFESESERAGLSLCHRSFHGQHYARTLARWHRRFARSANALIDLGYDARFQRMWRYYLAYCEVGFARGHIDLMHAVLERSDPCPAMP